MGKISESEVILKANGFKVTKSRKAILDILIDNLQPIDAEQISLILMEQKVQINLSTIYRTLEAFAKKAIVTKINIMDNKMFFEYKLPQHKHYLICISCKKIITVQKCPLHTYEKELEKELHFKVESHKLYLYGYCEECQKKLDKIK